MSAVGGGLLRELARGALDVVFGLHSNIPTCCVYFFVTKWCRDFARDGVGGTHGAEMKRLWRAGEELPRYTPCPSCWAQRRFVELHVCGRRPKRTCLWLNNCRLPKPLWTTIEIPIPLSRSR
jgi:hypothetical protein